MVLGAVVLGGSGAVPALCLERLVGPLRVLLAACGRVRSVVDLAVVASLVLVVVRQVVRLAVVGFVGLVLVGLLRELSGLGVVVAWAVSALWGLSVVCSVFMGLVFLLCTLVGLAVSPSVLGLPLGLVSLWLVVCL